MIHPPSEENRREEARSEDAERPPPVSVVMTVRQPEPAFLAAAIESCLAQTLPDFELVVLENPPHGAVTGVLQRYGDARIRHVRNPHIESLAASRNRALGLARGERIAVLDGDDVCAAERLERQCGFLDAHPEISVVGSQLAVIDDHGRPRGFRSYPVSHEEILGAMSRYNPVAQPAVMARAEALRSVGGYRAEYQGTCEDYDLWSRMARAGHRFANLPDALLHYRMHRASSKTNRLRANLRDTLWIKRRYWADRMNLGDRLRVAGERLLLLMPGAVVTGLFRRLVVRPALRRSEG